MGSPGAGLALMFLVLVITIFCSISITVAASRCTWAFARDGKKVRRFYLRRLIDSKQMLSRERRFLPRLTSAWGYLFGLLPW